MSDFEPDAEVVYVPPDGSPIEVGARTRAALTVIVQGPQGVPGIFGLPGEDGDDATFGPPGAQGIQGLPGVYSGATWFDGFGLPSDATGANGDFYVDLNTGNIFQKVAGTWGAGGFTSNTIVQGIPGITGDDGDDAWLVPAVGNTGPPGPPGPVGPTGLPPYVTNTLSLPSAGAAGGGTIAFVNDSLLSIAAGAGTVLQPSGSNFVPVYSDGTNWILWAGGQQGAPGAPGPSAYSGTVDPTAANDSTQGYGAGSIGENTATGRMFVARAVSPGAAVWNPVSSRAHPGYIVNNWYAPSEQYLSGTITPNATTLYAFPFTVEERITIAALAARVTTAQAAQNFQLAIYANASNRPSSTPLGTTPNISTASAVAVSGTLAASVQLEPGMVNWLALMTSSTSALFNGASSTNRMGSLLGSATLANLVGNQVALAGLTVSGQTFGSWPNLTGATFSEVAGGGVAHIVFQVGSVP